ncbi:response regulator [Polaromonas sp.]|uniref:response regulator n=2 Tax=Polaromonas sp. TaxID=1869339 RepID=UPI002736BBC6|nr:response regulator [Polaromonas sp.]
MTPTYTDFFSMDRGLMVTTAHIQNITPLPRARTPVSRVNGVDDASGKGASRSLKVFVIEDETVLRNLLVDALQEIPGVEVLFYADNEVSATNWLSSHDSAWDLAVVDLYLRQGSGVGALNWCITRREDQRVVVLSSQLSQEVRRKCLALRADAVFDKAGEMDDFLAYCRALVGSAAAMPRMP